MSELGCALATRDGKLLGESGVTAKEKLMLLIGSVPCLGEEHAAACPDRIMGSCGQAVRMDHCAIGRMADWLIANGVVVREKGEWQRVIPTKSAAKWSNKVACSVCHSAGHIRHNFCPNCGSDMRGAVNDG